MSSPVKDLWKRDSVVLEGKPYRCYVSGDLRRAKVLIFSFNGLMSGPDAHRAPNSALAARYQDVCVVQLPTPGSIGTPGPSRGKYDHYHYAKYGWEAIDQFFKQHRMKSRAVHLAGHSLSGAVVIQMAHDRPEQTKGVLAVCPAAGAPIFDFRVYRPGKFIRDMRRQVRGLKDDAIMDVIDNIRYALPQHGHMIATLFFNAVRHEAKRLGTEGIVPVQPFSSESDGLVPLPNVQKLAAMLNVDVILLEKGHSGQLLRPEEFALKVGPVLEAHENHWRLAHDEEPISLVYRPDVQTMGLERAIAS